MAAMNAMAGKPGARSPRQIAEDYRHNAAAAVKASKMAAGDVLEPAVMAVANAPAVIAEVAEASGREFGQQIRAAAEDAEGKLVQAAGEVTHAAEAARGIAETMRRSSAAAIEAANQTITAEAAKAKSALLENMQTGIEAGLNQAVAADRRNRSLLGFGIAAVAALVIAAGAYFAGEAVGHAAAREEAARLIAFDLDKSRRELAAAEAQIRSVEASAAKAREEMEATHSSLQSANLLRGVRPEVLTSIIEVARDLTPEQASSLARIVRQARLLTPGERQNLFPNARVPWPCFTAGQSGLFLRGGRPAESCVVELPPP